MTALSRMKRHAGRDGQPLSVYRSFAASERGNIAVGFALSLLPLTLFVGAGVDIGRWLHAREDTISAMDAAVLAGARALQTDSTNTAAAVAAAQAYYKENTKTRLKLASDSITFAPTDNNTTFRSSGNAYISTPILNLANISSLPLLKNNGTEYAKAVLSAGGSSQTSVEIGLMLDVTGSMAGTKFTDLKSAATDLVNIVVSDTASTKTVKIGIVPFAQGVRLPSSANTAARGSPVSSKQVTYSSRWGTSYYTYYSTPCVVERTGTDKYTDAAPGSGNYVMTMYTSNGACDLSSDDEVLPLSSDKTALTNKINGLDIGGGTAGQVGTAWAWYVLSPNWNTLWSSSPALAYNPAKLQKIAILMTDGEYNTEYDANGIATYNTGAGAAANTDSTTQARAVCTAMKNAGVTVYTVGFDLGGNATAIQTLSQCATDTSKFYDAADGSQLKQAFRDIALKINQLFLTH